MNNCEICGLANCVSQAECECIKTLANDPAEWEKLSHEQKIKANECAISKGFRQLGPPYIEQEPIDRLVYLLRLNKIHYNFEAISKLITIPIAPEKRIIIKSSYDKIVITWEEPNKIEVVDYKSNEKNYQEIIIAVRYALENGKFATEIRTRKAADKIRLIAKYYGISYGTAQNRYIHLKAQGRLNEICEKAERGEMAGSQEGFPPECPKCHSGMRIKNGRFGKFWGCVGYPACNGTINIENRDKPTQEAEEQSIEKLKIAMKFIREIGNIEEARNWLGIAIQSIEGQHDRKEK